MIIAGIYSFNGGERYINAHFPVLVSEVKGIIKCVEGEKSKRSSEKTMTGKMLYSPVSFNGSFKEHFSKKGWRNRRVPCTYPTQYYTPHYTPQPLNAGAFRDVDFVKDKLGVEVQFGKYSFMVYNVCAKMTIFKNLGIIDAGIEIVPVKDLANNMSSGVSYFEQFVWDLEQRGVADIDIPVLIIGVHQH